MENEMSENLMKRIDDLQRQIEAVDISMEARAVKEWGGADVIIKAKLNWMKTQKSGLEISLM